MENVGNIINLSIDFELSWEMKRETIPIAGVGTFIHYVPSRATYFIHIRDEIIEVFPQDYNLTINNFYRELLPYYVL